MATSWATSRDVSLTNKPLAWPMGDLVGSATSTTGTSATFTGHLVGTATIHAVNGALASVDSGTITVTPGPSVGGNSTVSASPTSVIADGSTTSTITVTLKDASGNPVAGKTVSLAKTSGPGTPTISAPSGTSNASGVVTFTVKSTTAGADVFTATDTTDSITITQTATVTFTIAPADANQSTLTPVSSSITANGSATQVLTVQAKDSSGNSLTSGGSTVTITKQSGTGTIGTVTDNANGTYTATVTAPTATGSGVFVATLGGSPVKSGTASQTQATVTYVPGTATHLDVTGLTSTTAGTLQSATVTARDAFNNVATGYAGSIHLTSTDGQAVLGADNTLTGGVGSFAVTLKTAGSQTVTATGSSARSPAPRTVTVSPAAIDHFVVSAPASATAGSPISVTVTAEDAYGNTKTNYTGTIHFTSSDGAAVLPGNYAFLVGDAGVHTFASGVTLKTAGVQTVSVNDTVTTAATGTSGNITVNPAALASTPSPGHGHHHRG